MGRAARRQQERLSRRQPRAAAPGRSTAPPPTAAAVSVAGARGRFRWAKDIISELRKVTWPTRQEVMHLTVVVIVVSIAFAAVLGAADVGISWVVERTILR